MQFPLLARVFIIGLVAYVFALAAPSPGSAQTDRMVGMWVGTWKINLAKSTFRPGPPLNAIFMFEHVPPLRGRAAIQQWGETNIPVTGLTFSDIDVHGSGDTAWATSAFTLMVEGAATPTVGKQLVVLQRQEDGSWLTVAASVSTDTPPPAGTP